MNAISNQKQKRLPSAVIQFMAEYEETEQSVREYILRQLHFFSEIEDKAGSTAERWLGFKLGCTAAAAKAAIRWAESPTPTRKKKE